MNNFLKHIPGFRSNKIWKKVIACIYYFIAFTALFADKGVFLLFIAAPFFIFSMVDLFKAKKSKKPMRVAAMTLAASLIFMSVGIATTDTSNTKQAAEKEKTTTTTEKVKKEEPKKEELEDPKNEAFEKIRDLKVHFIDVGQGDSILVQLPNGETALIDGGPKPSSDVVIDYLKKQNVEQIDYLIASNINEAYIGGLPEIIKKFDISNVYIPSKTHDNQIFKDLLLTIQDKEIDLKVPMDKDMLLDKEGLSLVVLFPESNSGNDNIVLKLTYKDNSFLFSGNAEEGLEQTMLNGGYDLAADVLKVGHHGSDTSTTEQFLDKVNPRYAIISVGEGNQYGYPSQSIMDRLTSKITNVYRTDENGTIVITSDGERLKIDFEKSAEPKQENAPPEKEEQSTEETKKATTQDNSQTVESNTQSNSSSNSNGNTGSSGGNSSNQESTGSSGSVSKPAPPATDGVEEVYITNTGKKYHRGSCGSLSKSKIPISLNKAKSQGYGPCKRCSPPQ